MGVTLGKAGKAERAKKRCDKRSGSLGSPAPELVSMQKSSREVTQSPNPGPCAHSCYCTSGDDILAVENRRNWVGISVRFISNMSGEELQWSVLTVAWRGIWEYVRNSLNRVNGGGETHSEHG